MDSICRAFVLLGIIVVGFGSLRMWWEMLMFLELTGPGAAFFAGGTGIVLITLMIQDKLLHRPALFRRI